LLADPDYGDAIYGFDFAPDGGLIVASDDGAIRRYASDLHRTAKRGPVSGKDPVSVSLGASGARAVVGYCDSSRASLLDAVTLAPLAEVDAKNITKKADVSFDVRSPSGAAISRSTS
jgi:hypothetical protein